jgi:hypothetical protein
MHKAVGTFNILSTKVSSGIIFNRKFGEYLHNAMLSSLVRLNGLLLISWTEI